MSQQKIPLNGTEQRIHGIQKRPPDANMCNVPFSLYPQIENPTDGGFPDSRIRHRSHDTQAQVVIRQRHFVFLLKTVSVLCVCILALLADQQLLAATKPIPIITEVTRQLNEIEAALVSESLSQKRLQQLRKRLLAARSKANKELKRLTPMLQDAQARFEALKPSDESDAKAVQPSGKDGKNDAQVKTLSAQRDKISIELASLHSSVKLVNSLIVRADQLNNRISAAKEKNLATQLLERSRTLLSPQLWLEGLRGIPPMWQAIQHLFAEWSDFLSQKKKLEIWQAAGMVLLVIGVVLWPFRLALSTFLARFSRAGELTALQKSLRALLLLFSYTISPVAIVGGAVLIFNGAELLPDRICELNGAVVQIAFFTAVGYGLSRVILSPQHPGVRLVNLDSPAAVKLFGIILLSLGVYAISSLSNALGDIVLIPAETMLLVRGVASIFIAVLLWLGFRLVNAALEDQENEGSPQRIPLGSASFILPRLMSLFRPLIWPGCILIIAAPLLGYISLGTFLTDQLGLILVVLGLLGILTALVDNVLCEGLENDTARTRAVARAMGFKSKTILQLGVLANGILRILLYLAAGLIIFAPWGLQSTDFVTSLKTAVVSIQIGSLTISPIRIGGAIIAFIFTLLLVRGTQNWMVNRLFPATKLDMGLKNSIVTSVGYLGFILATMLAFSYLGIDLSKLALVAGALSVGIGFGLQSIVNNFVSGLILLVERPIKMGDWVVVGSDQGYVQKISVRATTIQTFDRATVIVPNADLISNRVKNFMYSSHLGRIIIPIGVSYDADPEQVREILLQVAKDSPLIARFPEPRVYFMDFGASSLDFELRCYIQDVDNSVSAKSELRFSIFKALKEADIEIPFPQQDVHLRTLTTIEQPPQGQGGVGQEKEM